MTTPITDDGRSGAEVPVLNIANVLTVLRIVLVPVFVVLFFVADAQDPWWRVGAFVVFVLAMATDYVDGYLARRLGLVTDFGKIADPIADKLLTGAAFIVLSVLGELWWWVTLLILLREWGITLMRLVVLRYGVMPASRGGKLKTVLQAGALLLLLAPLAPLLGDWYPWAGWTVMAAALAVTLVTGADYVLKAVRLRRAALSGGERS